MSYDQLGWEIRCCLDLIDRVEQIIESYEMAPETWHTRAPCSICIALGTLGPMLENLHRQNQKLQRMAVQQHPPFVQTPTLH